MGISWSSNSSNNRRRNSYYQNPHPPSQFFSSSPYPYPPDPPYTAPPPYPYPTHPPPPPPPANPMYSSYYYSGGYNACHYHNPVMGRSNFGPYYYAYPNNGWTGIQPPMVAAAPPPAYVEHQEAKRVKNDVNVHKDTLRLEIDEAYPGQHLVSFVFDALFDGSITIFYFAKEEPSCKVIPVFPESYMPVKIPLQKGLGQKFCQPSGTGIDLGFFNLGDLSKPSGEDVFPLVILPKHACLSLPMDGYLSYPSPNTSPHMQITQAVLEKNNGDPFKVRVIK